MASTESIDVRSTRPGAPERCTAQRASRILATAVAAVLCVPLSVHGQASVAPEEPPSSVPLRIGPLALAPAISLTNAGWDSNVFHRQADADPVSDIIATVKPQVKSWMRFGRLRAQARNTLELAYFQEHPNERSLDMDHEGRLDLSLARLTPYVSGRWINARQRFGFEIDERTRRQGHSATAGLDLRLGARTNVDISARQSRLEFKQSEGVRDEFAWQFYDYTSRGLALSLRQRLTPLTAVNVTVNRTHDRFDLVPWRDSDSVAVTSGLEFQPFAMITGRASVGWRRLELAQSEAPPFSGLVTSIDLAYTLLGATRFAVQARRDLSYSAMEGQHAFLLSGFSGSVTHRFPGSWDIGGRVGNYRISYDVFRLPADTADVALSAYNRETVTEYGGEIGYRLGRDLRLAFDLGRHERRSSVYATRQYVRTLATMSVSYGF